MKKAIIVEAPTKIKTIKSFLPDDYSIVATMGHIKDLPPKKIGVNISKSNEIEIEYAELENKEKAIKNLISGVKGASKIFLASDPDREGEIIALHAKEIIESKFPKTEIKRITFNEINKEAIIESIKHPRDIDYCLVKAQQARRIMDRWVGYKVSPILWRKVQKGLSAGRVQSVALKIVCLREEEIKDFIQKEYWSIHAKFLVEGSLINADLSTINGKKAESIEKDQIEKTILQVPKENWTVDKIKDTKKKKNPNAPFITSTMQQAAYNELGMNVQQTMSAAQKLYEGIEVNNKQIALITYMRTDSTRISNTAITEVRKFIKSKIGEKYLPEHKAIYSKKGSQDAHEAIRPVNINATPDDIKPYVEGTIYKLYDLIWRRFVACQMKPTEMLNRQILFKSPEKFVFKATGSSVLFDGFLKVLKSASKDEAQTLPPALTEGSSAQIKDIEKKQHFTQPPSRYNEASMIKELESKRIGRPSTYSAILRTIRDRLYTYLDNKKRFVPTPLGIMVFKILNENMQKIMDIKFTAHMEEELDEISNSEKERDVVLLEFYKEFEESLKIFENKKIDKTVEKTDLNCEAEKCDGKLIIKMSRVGEFLGCENFPDCTYNSSFDRNKDGSIIKIERKNDVIDELCPECGKNLCNKIGRFGKFIACTGYPECKHIKKEKTKALCTACQKFPLVKKMWKSNIFWSCESYPKCKFSINGDILEKECSKCKNQFFVKSKKDDLITCSNDKCKFKTQEVDL
jgi:DNA topoisomerase I